jgi:hypothetical protein
LVIAAVTLGFCAFGALILDTGHSSTDPAKFNSVDGTAADGLGFTGPKAQCPKVARGCTAAVAACRPPAGVCSNITPVAAMAEMLMLATPWFSPRRMSPRGETEVCTEKVADQNHREPPSG